MEHLDQFAIAMGLAWASGVRLYAAIAVVGLAGRLGYVDLPQTLAVLQDPWVIGVALCMYVVEFVADKIPWVDSTWDALQTFVRVPAGMILAATTLADISPEVQIIAALLGGVIASGAHLTKAGSRAVINTSPEPFTNWGASIGEEATVYAGLWLAFAHPIAFLLLLLLFVGLTLWLIPKLWRALGRVFARLGALFRPPASS